MFAFIFFLILIFPSENMSNNLELDVQRLEKDFNSTVTQIKSDIAKLIQEVDKLNKRISVLPPSVIHHDIKPRSGDDFFFNGEGHFVD
jgi:hypothetical protein